MTAPSLQLLKRLEPAVRPGISPPSLGVKAHAALETQSFDQLLAMARKGDIHSGRQIQLSFEPATPLQSSQLERLADAADQAESAGLARALMMIDGRAFVLDVKNRTLTTEIPIDSTNLVQNLEGAVFVGGHVGESHQIKRSSGIPASPPSLTQLLNASKHNE